MSKIAFFCIPAHGHTNPTLGVVRELTARGHEVRYYSYDLFQEKIEEAGAEFISCDAYDAELQPDPDAAARIGKDIAFSTHILVDITLAMDQTLCEDMRKFCPDCIVADSMAIWGKAAALKLHIPFVSSTTTFAFNKYSARIMQQSFGALLRMIISMPKINKDLKRLQDHGYPIRNIIDLMQSDPQTNTIVYTSPQFQPCAETFPDTYAFVGPSVRPVTTQITRTREKLVYISMGTVNNDMLPFYRNCIAALADTDYQVILSVGDLADISALGSRPDNITVERHVDQIAVLAQADAFISHCGMNSVNESLYYRVPLILYPQTTEQGGVANRVAQLGAGIYLEETGAANRKRTVSAGNRRFEPAPAAIRSAVDRVLQDDTYRRSASAISDGFRSCSGAGGAADKILEVIAGGQ